MEPDRRDANQKMLAEAEETQRKTREAVDRMRQQMAVTEEVGAATLEQLRSQGGQMDELSGELTGLNYKLEKSKQLQGTFDAWAGNWGGWKKSAAGKEAENYIAAHKDDKLMAVRDVYEQHKYDAIQRKWRPMNFVLYSNPSTEVGVSFDPVYSAATKGSPWVVDYTAGNIDAQGWTYGSDASSLNREGGGSAKPLWNSYVRRRKWRLDTAKTQSAMVVSEVQERNQQRLDRAAAANKPAASTALKDTGFTTSTGRAKPDQKLDAESEAGLAKLRQNDSEIDEGLAALSGSLDTIFGMATAMKEETLAQNRKADRLQGQMGSTAEKAVHVNTRVKHMLK